jgi:two-component system chemotaxis response regulator CheB
LSINALIADDSAYLRKVISDILTEQDSITVVDRAKNGKEAIEMVRKYNPDVLVLDLLMPQMNGIDALEIIMEKYPTPTIILSAINPQQMDTSIQALLLGAFDYIIKPGGLGAKDLPTFQKELITKVLLAAESHIKQIFQQERENVNQTQYIRQTVLDKTFKFGQYLNALEPIEDIKENKILKEDFPETKTIKTNIVDIKQVKAGQGQIPLDSVKGNQITEIEPIEKISIEKVPQNDNIIEKKTAPTVIPQMTTKTIKNPVVKPLKPKESQLSKLRKKVETPKILPRKITPKRTYNTNIQKPITWDITPVKGVILNSNVIVMGASVGGPRTLKLILKELPDSLSCPILIVQHLTSNFIETFVNTLNTVCDVQIKVAKDGDIIQPKTVYIAPGDNHMEVSVKNNKPCIKIYKGTPVHFCMPSIDVLFSSAARVYKNRTMGILLTGMGEDGVDGLAVIKKLGGKTITESQETCVLYGMPKFAAERGVADLILPNFEIKDYILNFTKQ